VHFVAASARDGDYRTPEQLYRDYALGVQAVNPVDPGEDAQQDRGAGHAEDFTRERLPDLLDRTDWAVLTAEDPGAMKASPRERAAHGRLKATSTPWASSTRT